MAGVLFDLDSQANERPTIVQRMPSKLSSLAWDHNQEVCRLQLPTFELHVGPFFELAIDSAHTA